MVFAPDQPDLARPERKPLSQPEPRWGRADTLLSPVDGGRRSPWWIEAVMIVWLCWLYDIISNLTPLRNVAAIDHARSVLHLETVLHVDPEMTLNHWLAAHQTLGLWLSNYYDNAHFVVTLSVVGWLWWRHPSHYRPLRNGLVLANVIGFFVFWRYPMAPPRMLSARFVDIVASTGAFGAWHSGVLAKHANELAAMPSMHLAWAMWSSWAVFRVWRHKRWIFLVWLYPAFTGVVVLATGNHFVLDVVAGCATAAVAVWAGDQCSMRWVRWRTERGAPPVAATPADPSTCRPAAGDL